MMSCPFPLKFWTSFGILFTLLHVVVLVRRVHSQPGSCLGEFQLCSNGVCALDASLCSKCSTKGQYVCPISNACVSSVNDYEKCPNLKGTHLDWTLSIDDRVNYLLAQLTVDEKYPQLTNEAASILRMGLPYYDWRSNDVHSVMLAHSTVFPDGCGMGAMWSKDQMNKIGNIISLEARSLHNTMTHEGIRNNNDGEAITSNAPNINLVRDPRWGRAQEVYSEDPRLSGHLVYELVSGMQMGYNATLNSTKYFMFGAQCKHFAVYNIENVPESRTHIDVMVDAVDWAETYTPVFRECVVRAQGTTVMCSYNAVNGLPACGSGYILTDVLRKQWNFTGFVVSDYDAMEQIYSTHHYANSSEEALAIGMKAGCDMEGGGTTAIKTVPKALADGLITMDDLNLAVGRVFRLRIRLGLLDPPTMVPYNVLYNNTNTVCSESSLNEARKSAAISVGLYKNENNALPLVAKDVQGIAVIGPQAIGTELLLGNYCKYPDSGVVTIVQGLRAALGENVVPNCTYLPNIVYEQAGQTGVQTYSYQECCSLCFEDSACNFWSFTSGSCFLKATDAGKQSASNHVSGQCLNKNANSRVQNRYGCANPECTSDSGFSAALDLISSMHANGMLSQVILGLGLSQNIEREGHDRTTIELPGLQNELVSQIASFTSAHSLPLICVLVHGGTMALGAAADKCDAIVDAWYPGMMGGYGIADVLFNAVNPSGRASVTSYLSTSDLPKQNGDVGEYPDAKGNPKGVTYRYFAGDVLFPFGYGLSYTQFSYSNLVLNLTKTTQNGADYVLEHACDIIKVSFTVTNTGGYVGSEVVQLYVEQPDASVPVPKIRLGDFDRVADIGMGAANAVKFDLILTPRYRSTVHNATSQHWYEPDIQIEKGNINLFVGGGQPQYFAGALKTVVYVSQGASFYTCADQD